MHESVVCENPVFSFRNAVIASKALQERIIKSGEKADFLALAKDCGYECTTQDLVAALDDIRTTCDGIILQGDGTLPLGGDEPVVPLGTGTMPVRVVLSLINLLSSALHTLANDNDGAWALEGADNLVVFGNWLLPSGVLIGNG